MAGVYVNNIVRWLRVGPSGAITYPDSSGWTIFFMFNPKPAQNNPAYLYSHNEVLQIADSVNIRLAYAAGPIHCRVEDPSLTALENDTSNSVVSDVWNAFALVWDTSNFRLYLNGVQTVYAPGSPTKDYNPPDFVHMGIHSDLFITTPFNGSICHVMKLDRPLTINEGLKYTDILVSPEFAQNDKDFHVEMFNSDTYDLQNNRTVTQSGMVYGPQAPASYPSMVSTTLDDEAAPAGKSRLIYVGA